MFPDMCEDKKAGWMATLGGIAVIALIVVLVVGSSVYICRYSSAQEAAEQKAQNESVVATTRVPYGIIQTVKHDGHLYTIYRGGTAKEFIHSPNCPCGKKE